MLKSVGLFVTLVDACNLDCQFCEFPGRPEFRNGNELNYEKFVTMLQDVKKCPPEIPLGAVCFCGSGEPLLYQKIVEIVAETKKVVPQASIVTNGVLLTENICRGLLETDINHIVVSITGNTENVYRHYQGSGKKTFDIGKQFETVRQNVKMLVHLRDQMQAHTQIGISYILSDESIEDYFSALAYWHRSGVDYVDTRILSKGFCLNEQDFETYIKENADRWEGG